VRELVVVEADEIHGSESFDEGLAGVGNGAAVLHPHAGGLVLTDKEFLAVRAANVQPLSALHGALGEIDSIEKEKCIHWNGGAVLMAMIGHPM